MTGIEIKRLVFEMIYRTHDQEAKGFLRSASALLSMAFITDESLKGQEIVFTIPGGTSK